MTDPLLSGTSSSTTQRNICISFLEDLPSATRTRTRQCSIYRPGMLETLQQTFRCQLFIDAWLYVLLGTTTSVIEFKNCKTLILSLQYSLRFSKRLLSVWLPSMISLTNECAFVVACRVSFGLKFFLLHRMGCLLNQSWWRLLGVLGDVLWRGLLHPWNHLYSDKQNSSLQSAQVQCHSEGSV